MIGYTLGAFPMLRLGAFTFGVNTAAYQELRRRTEYKWAAQERFSQIDALQFTGPGEDNITLNGVILPAYRGGTGQLDILRSLAAIGQPQTLITGGGSVLGLWSILSVDEGQGVFAALGIPRRQEFTLSLKKFSDDLLSALIQTLPTDAGGVADVVGGASDAQSSLSKFASNVSKTVSDAASSVSDAVSSIQQQAAEIGQAAAPVIATAVRAYSSVVNVQSAVTALKGSIAGIKSASDVPNLLGGVMTASSAATNAAALASGAAKSATSITTSGAETLKFAAASCGQAAVSCSQVYGAANTITKKFTP